MFPILSGTNNSITFSIGSFLTLIIGKHSTIKISKEEINET